VHRKEPSRDIKKDGCFNEERKEKEGRIVKGSVEG